MLRLSVKVEYLLSKENLQLAEEMKDKGMDGGEFRRLETSITRRMTKMNKAQIKKKSSEKLMG